MFRRSIQATRPFYKAYSTAGEAAKVPVKLVAELRKRTEVSLTKAREALSATNNDVNAALDWLQQDLITTGAKKASKLQDRATGEGLVSTAVLSRGIGSVGQQGRVVRGALVELNCETDFVGRNELFQRLARDIARTAAFHFEEPGPDHTSSAFLRACDLAWLNDAPLMSEASSSTGPSGSPPQTVESAIKETIAKVGENIVLRRATAVMQSNPGSPNHGLRLAAYAHGSLNNGHTGRVGALALLALKSPELPALFKDPAFATEVERLEAAIARQTVGFDTRSVYASEEGVVDETALYDQQFMMNVGGIQDETVRIVLEKWAEERKAKVAVLDLARWTVGEAL